MTGIDASSSASLAAYINTLTQTAQDKSNKVISGLYWFVTIGWICGKHLFITVAIMPFHGLICESKSRFPAGLKATV